MRSLLLLAVVCPLVVSGGVCPGLLQGTPSSQKATVPTSAEYNEALAQLHIPSVIQDIVHLLTESQKCWPADTFSKSDISTSYGGLFIRLAWHCAGSFRSTDGAGGCGGGRMRFPPESSWPDNTNLDKARALLWPIKKRYGDGLSWGDLFILAGSASILHMGGPAGSEICVGRIDDADGSASNVLGPGDEQPPCPQQGNCSAPLGTSTVGLIYVNPEGFLGNPCPVASAAQIRDVFGRMDMNDSESVALIGGGHAFGKSHGACPLGAGPGPDEQPFNPWPGNCCTGKGGDTVTSGIEGPWTSDPFKWDNEYFEILNEYGDEFKLERGPGGKWQWRNPRKEGLMMLTTDIAFLHDPVYADIVKTFAEDPEKLDIAFGAAWEKLTMRGAVWATGKKCWKTDDRFTSDELCQAPIKKGEYCGKSPHCCAEGTKCYKSKWGAARCKSPSEGRNCKEVTRKQRKH
ncbi:Catalase-peroxidase 1 [Diplonema papillatum]|nr:Catalase-peroxidase 1 [Diplonema papillatum]KAJ9436444.1 Catalase-peroxidase 1 [Diplonema papillatum]KAJ9436446.1 Catalase-peroxidase 1 [Diplonema papillatum]KAJ9454521.1 Catalase-peroxidase 1 [Diplonema papillatum]